MPKYYRTIVERNIDSSKDENTLKISTDDPTVTKMTLNDKEIKSGTYTRKLSDGTLVSSNPTTVVKEDVASNKTAVAKEEKAVKADDKKVVVEKEEDKRTFWQRHPVLRVLLTIFLCLLLIGLLMIAAYHIMNAINNAKKNDNIDDAKKADEDIKNNKDKLSKENQKKLEEGTLTKDDVNKEVTRQESDQKLAQDTKDYIDKYNKETDATKKGEISTQYADSQGEALKSGKLNSTSLKETLKNEQSELDVAKAGVDEAAKSASSAGITDTDIASVKTDSEATIDTASFTDDQNKALEALRESVKKQTLEQADVTYVENKLKDVQAYESATTDTAKETALTTFTDNEKTRFTGTTTTTEGTTTTPPAISSEDASKWISQESSELQSAQDFSKSFDTISDISKDNGFTYKAGTTTAEEMTTAIENNYADKFPKSDGAFRIAGDAAAAAGAAGLIGTGIAALIAKSGDKNKKTVVKQNVDNGCADNNIKTVTQTTNTVTK